MLDVVHNGCVDEAVFIASASLEPVNDCGDCNADVLGVELEFGEVSVVTTLIEIGDIDEMPVGLPTTTSVLDHVSERS